MRTPDDQAQDDSRWPGAGGGTSAFGTDDTAQVRLQAALTAGNTAAWLTNLQTRERWWSPEMFAIHGLRTHVDVPADYIALVHPEDRERVQAAFARSIATGSHEVQYRVRWPDGSVHWLEGAGRTTRDAQGRPLVITGISSCIDGRVREQQDLRFLARASAEFAQSSDYEGTLRRVAGMAVPHFADWCAVDMLDAGELRRLAVAHVDPAKLDVAADVHRRYPPDPAAPRGTWNVLRSGEAELVPEITDEMLAAAAVDDEHLRILRSLGLRSYMGLPIVGRSGVPGVITFVAAESGRRYGERDLDLAQNLVSRAADAIQNAQLFQALRESDRRKDFLLQLTDVLRSPASIPEVLHAVSRMLGGHFGVDRVGYGHVDEHLDLIEYDVCWTDGSVPPLLGSFPASAFGQRVIDRLRAGETVAIANVREHPLTSDNAALRTSQEVDTRAILVVPLFKAGRLRTIVYLNQRPAREWDAAEVALMEEVAERTRELIERGRVEAALRESESRWRGLFERMSEGFFVGEAIRDGTGRMVDFRFMEVNPAFERLTGVPVDAAVGRRVTEVIPGVQPELIATYAHVVDTGEPAEFEAMVPALDDRWYEARASRVASEQFSVLFVEITQRKAAEIALARSAERYRALFEAIDEGFCILQVLFDEAQQPQDYRFLEVNPAFERQSGLEGAVGRTIRELVPDIERTYIDTYGRVALTGEPIRFESHASALRRWFDAFAFRIGEPAQRLVGLLFTDITERKLAQDALVEREAQLSEAQRLANIGSWSWDPVSDRTHASPELLRIFGLPPDASFPPFAQQRGTLYAPHDWDRLHEAVQLALERGQSYSVDLRAWRNGQPIWVIARGTVVRDASGRVTGLRGTVQDITERKQVEEQLREADARKDEFLATLAHELRNPLAPLRNGLSILRLTGSEQPSAVRARELMERQMAHLVRLVDDLLDVSRVSRGKVAMKKTVASLQGVVELALETSRPLVDAAGHALVVDLPGEPVLLHADVTRMAQVLSNLLNNAAKYTPEAGRIMLRARLDGPARVRVTVEDNGVGIPPDMLDQVFELFAQVGHAGDRSQGGLGIGLSLARRLVELHGGTIRAHSEGEGRGSCFTVELPVLQGRSELSAGAPQSTVPLAGAARRVLVVDDNQDAAETLRVLLELEGHQVQVAHTGSQALDAAEREQPDVVFLDIGLPDISGYQVAERLRRNPALRATRLVALTGWGAESDRQQARAAGIDLHLTKPVTPADLARALQVHGAA